MIKARPISISKCDRESVANLFGMRAVSKIDSSHILLRPSWNLWRDSQGIRCGRTHDRAENQGCCDKIEWVMFHRLIRLIASAQTHAALEIDITIVDPVLSIRRRRIEVIAQPFTSPRIARELRKRTAFCKISPVGRDEDKLVSIQHHARSVSELDLFGLRRCNLGPVARRLDNSMSGRRPTWRRGNVLLSYGRPSQATANQKNCQRKVFHNVFCFNASRFSIGLVANDTETARTILIVRHLEILFISVTNSDPPTKAIPLANGR